MSHPGYDPLADAVIRCELVLDTAGTAVTVNRVGCTPEDVLDLCRLILAGDPVVQDVTPA